MMAQAFTALRRVNKKLHMTSHNLCSKNDFAPTPRNKVHIKYSRMVASKEREEGGGRPKQNERPLERPMRRANYRLRSAINITSCTRSFMKTEYVGQNRSPTIHGLFGG